jgi:hypothetical protein
LKTAAHNSARFPLISPLGSVRNQKNELVARIVDGGYFENYGALAAKELALAVRSVDPSLQPLVIVVSNDPGDLLSSDDDAVPPETVDKTTKGSPSELATEIAAPLNTVIATRSAHGVLAVDQLRTARPTWISIASDSACSCLLR